MPSDKTRSSDETLQGYKGPVMQQGRVILDRDFNALRETLDDAIAADALQLIGPAGTPDNGFDIRLPVASPPTPPYWSPPGPLTAPATPPHGDFLISPGTMYVGGQRAVFPPQPNHGQDPYTYSYFDQPDWVHPPDPAAASPSALAQELVYLHLSEQEVSSVEDPDLKDVALGGPDTTQRVRLLRRVKRQNVTDKLCAQALNDASAAWAQNGLLFDPDTMRLIPMASVQVSFAPTQASVDPCDPVSQGGYLGPDNQLIRVQISRADGTPCLLWAYDNASFIYRVSASADFGTLTLQQSPVDAFHSPAKGQVIEILQTAGVLGSDPDETNPLLNPEVVRCFAEAHGEIRALAQNYDPAARTLTLDQPMLTRPLGGTPLFARIWQAALPFNTAGDTVELTSTVDGTPATTQTTGIQVTIAFPSGGTPPLGAYWMIAVRPNTPQAIYPERFLNGPQLPDGPRQWVCPLAVIDWMGSGSPPQPVVTDCRQQFDNLVTRTAVEDLISTVIQFDASGQPARLNDGDTLEGNDLAQGLEIDLIEAIDVSTANVGSCFVSLELPFLGPDKSVIGFQPVTAAGGVTTKDATTIVWKPTANAAQFLKNQLATQLQAAPAAGTFTATWDVFPPPPQAAWEYTAAGAEANIAAGTAFGGPGCLAVNHQALPTGATTLKMTVTPPVGNPAIVGLVFNYLNVYDYWAFTFTSNNYVSEDGGSHGTSMFLSLSHVVGGVLQSKGESPAYYIAGTPGTLDLMIDVSGAALAFSATLTYLQYTSNSFQTETFGLTPTPPPGPASAPAPAVAVQPPPIHLYPTVDPIRVPLANPIMFRPETTPAVTPIHVAGVIHPTQETEPTSVVIHPTVTPVFPVNKLPIIIPPPTFQAPAAAAAVTVAPGLQRILAGSQVGISTNNVGKTDFSALQITYAGVSQPQVLLPLASAGRVLGRLTVKRDLLKPADVQGDIASGSRPDFSRWFWVTPSLNSPAHYYYYHGSGGGSAGIGSVQSPQRGGL